ncbi:MAG: fibronectin type III domain-containing protein [Gammaproteobacteria bacterium]|nr:fibronectin type III domain-containing protein [Gammaproteobacteria bacterium]NVK87956.1 fibronectin type III domain-containing protein [Gammaproteobacteria bacterium]
MLRKQLLAEALYNKLLTLGCAVFLITGCSNGAEERSVEGGNSPPNISIFSPESSIQANEHDAIYFQGQALDQEDGDISYSIQWRSDISGVLADGRSFEQTLEVGSHLITAAVTDSDDATNEQSVRVEVVEANGNASVFWVPPTENVDDTPLTDLAGFKVYYGQNAQRLDRYVSVSGASTTTALIENLTNNRRYYFAVAAVNSLGVESDLSEMVAKDI